MTVLSADALAHLALVREMMRAARPDSENTRVDAGKFGALL